MSRARKFLWGILLLCALFFGIFRLDDGGYLENYPWIGEFILRCRLFLGDERAALDEAQRLAWAMRSDLKNGGLQVAAERYNQLAELNKRFTESVSLTDEQMNAALDLLIAQGKSEDIEGAKMTYRRMVGFSERLSGEYRIERRKLQGAYLMLYFLKGPERLDDALDYVERADSLRRGFKADIHTVRIGVAGLRETTLGCLKHGRFEEGKRVYRHLQELRAAYPDDADSAREHLIAAVWGAWYCVKNVQDTGNMLTNAPLADVLIQDAAALVEAFPSLDGYLERRAETMTGLISAYLYLVGDWNKAQAVCDALLALSPPSQGKEMSDGTLWDVLVDSQFSGVQTLMVARASSSDMVGAKGDLERLYVLSEPFVQPSRSENVRYLVERRRADASTFMISHDVGIGDFAAAREIYDQRMRPRAPAASREDLEAMNRAMVSARMILRAYLAEGNLTSAQEWYDELRRLQNHSGTVRDWRGDPMLKKIELLMIEAEAAGDMLAAHAEKERVGTAAKLYARIEDLTEEAGFFGMYSLSAWIDAAMRMVFYRSVMGDKTSAKNYGRDYAKTNRIWKELLEETSLLPSWEDEVNRQRRLALALIEKYKAQSRKDLRRLHDGITALRALSPFLETDPQLSRLQAEIAGKSRQAKKTR